MSTSAMVSIAACSFLAALLPAPPASFFPGGFNFVYVRAEKGIMSPPRICSAVVALSRASRRGSSPQHGSDPLQTFLPFPRPMCSCLFSGLAYLSSLSCSLKWWIQPCHLSLHLFKCTHSTVSPLSASSLECGASNGSHHSTCLCISTSKPHRPAKDAAIYDDDPFPPTQRPVSTVPSP